ncbi:orotidine-5'-phosphate decarboxylase [bacterium]|jgi:orotidine-5'-phosphate decarboxylase|nr:orotidine-5'-phosphate decarboxylase [bacterium]
MINSHPVINRWLTNRDRINHSLCVGIDPDMDKLPDTFPKTIDGMEQFLIHVIESTQEDCISYKPNMAFFEAMGIEGLRLLERLCKRIPDAIPIIMDGKRGDIGNTSKMQAKFIFDYFGADASTLHPYMGSDSLRPFFEYKDKMHFVLGLTSNPGSQDFEKKNMADGQPLYHTVIKQCIEWNQDYGNIGMVVGATHDELANVREIAEQLPFLIPGVGAQGGTYSHASDKGKNLDGLVLINASRAVLYPSKGISHTQAIHSIIKS